MVWSEFQAVEFYADEGDGGAGLFGFLHGSTFPGSLVFTSNNRRMNS